jgi:hypothetical protein
MAKCKSILFLHADARLSTVALPTYRDDLAVAEPTIPHATGTCTRDLGCFQLPVSRAALFVLDPRAADGASALRGRPLRRTGSDRRNAGICTL